MYFLFLFQQNDLWIPPPILISFMTTEQNKHFQKKQSFKKKKNNHCLPFLSILVSFIYSPFHKTLTRSSSRMHWISVRFYEMGDIWSQLLPLLEICLLHRYPFLKDAEPVKYKLTCIHSPQNSVPNVLDHRLFCSCDFCRERKAKDSIRNPDGPSIKDYYYTYVYSFVLIIYLVRCRREHGELEILSPVRRDSSQSSTNGPIISSIRDPSIPWILLPSIRC